MGILKEINKEIERIGIKETARRANLSPSTVSRMNSGQINPSFEVVQKISEAIGYRLNIVRDMKITKPPRLSYAQDVLLALRKELKLLGVRHAVVFGSVARKEDHEKSDIDIYIDFPQKPSVSTLLKAEGRIIEEFGTHKVDIISWISPSEKNDRILTEIEKDGLYVF